MAAAFVLDRASILERLGGDEEIYAMMVDMFVADVENNCTALATALAAMPRVQALVHTGGADRIRALNAAAHNSATTRYGTPSRMIS